MSASIAGREESTYLVPLLLAFAVGLVFWLPAGPVGRGYFPVPLDDVYIHFDYARSLAGGRPFEWIAGQGYSSGETSPLYAAALAIGWLLGFRNGGIGVWAALLAIVSVASLVRSIRELARPMPAWLGWLVALLPLSIGVVDWALFSGMEVALFVMTLGRALVALRAATAPRVRLARQGLQWRLGFWGAVLVLLRPEAAVLVAVFAVAAARSAGARSGILAVARAAIPGAAATLAVLGTNLLATGDYRSAGAQLKLLSSNPYLSDVDRARVFAENLVTFWVKIVRGSLAPKPGLLLVIVLLWALALAYREYRTVAATSLVAAFGWILLVSWNANAPHHNFRYYVPALVLLYVAAALGIAALGRLPRRGLPAAATVTALTLAVGMPTLPSQVRHFRSACANIRGQQVEVGERVARLPGNPTILLGDAGAIPFVSGRGAVDALGLGGYRTLPFARAALHGEGATVELIERLEPSQRPTYMALYPNWFAALTSRFGTEIDRVTIDDNVICGSPTKAIYRADWSALDDAAHGANRAGLVDEVDIDDVIDEAAHAYRAPLPHGGWSTLDVLTDASESRRFDGGRIIPAGTSESFVAKASSSGPVVLRMRIDHGARGITVRAPSTMKPLELDPPRPDHWRSGTVTLPSLTTGDVIELVADGGEYRNYHVWIERTPAAAR